MSKPKDWSIDRPKMLLPLRYRPLRDLKEFQRARPKFHEQAPEDRHAGMASRYKLIREEMNEALDEIDLFLDGHPNASLENLAKELADSLYVIYGTAEYLGIPLEEVFRAVHKSNLTKLDATGQPHAVVDGSGKFAKGPHYVPADVHGAMTGVYA